MEKNDRGILWNFAFLNSFNNAGIIEKNNESEEKSTENKDNTPNKDNDTAESINDMFLKTYLKTVILEEDEVKPPFKIKESPPALTKLGVSFEFNKVNFCEGCKRKDYINANRVTSMDGSIFLKFYTDARRYNSSSNG